jgi:multiple antibiotic resistance protein
MGEYILNALVTLFVTIDPIALAPMFMVLTSGYGPVARREAALRACLTAGAVLVAFALVGEALIGVLGISISAFKIAGGLLLFVIAFEMVFERRSDRKAATAEKASETDLGHLAIFPLAIPLISGPGAISATILLASQASGWLQMAVLILVIVALIASCFAVFLLAPQIERTLGETGRLVLSRLLGIILAALAVQFVADGAMAITGIAPSAPAAPG